MKKCNKCNITYNTNRFTCPFCKSLLEETNESQVITEYQEYPKFKDKVKKVNLPQKILLFLSLIAIIVVFITNYYEYKKGNHSLWSLIALMSIITIWSFIKGLIISKKNPAKRIFTFGFNLSLLILSIEYFSITNKGDYTNWSLNYVIPFILVATLLAITIVTLANHKNFSDYVGYIFWTSVLLMSYRLLHIFNICDVLWTSLLCLLYGFTTLIALLFFAGKNTLEEVKKRFTI